MLLNEFAHQVAGRLKGGLCLPFQNQHFKALETTPAALSDQGYVIHLNPDRRHLSISQEISHPYSQAIGGEPKVLQALNLLRSPDNCLLSYPRETIQSLPLLIVRRVLSTGVYGYLH